MSQETRRRPAARGGLRGRIATEDELPERRRVRRFSGGLERAVLDRLRLRGPEPAALHVGRYDDIERAHAP